MNTNHRRSKSELLQTAREFSITTLTIVVTGFHKGRRHLSQNSSDLSRLAWRRFLLAPRRLPWSLLVVGLLLSLKSGCVPRATVEPLNEQKHHSSASPLDAKPDEHTENGRQSSPSRQHSSARALLETHQVEKPSIEGIDPLNSLIIQREQLDDDVELLVHGLTAKLPPREAAYISAIFRTHSSGQCLIELDDWSRSSRSVQLLESGDRQALLDLLQRWRAWELELASQGSAQ